MEFAKILREERTKANLKQSELGEKIGVSVQVLSSYETGIREPKIQTLIKIADIFDISLDQIVGRVRQDGNQFPLMDINDLEEQEMVEMYNDLSKDDKEKIRAIIKTLADIDKTGSAVSSKKNENTAG